ncbi:MAG: hypothetical protein ACR2HS_05970 [Gammaproteobacteria bacterium]
MGYNNLFFSFKKKPLIGFIATAVLVSSYYTYRQYLFHQRYPNSLYAVLDYYGFDSPAQKAALRYLMQQAGINNPDFLLEHQVADQTELSKLILTLVRETQSKFTIRTGNQERWEVETSTWMKDEEQQQQILAALNTLKMTAPIPPRFQEREVISILGGSKKIMELRLAYADELFIDNKLPSKWLVLLAGERYVTLNIDGDKQELSNLANKLGKDIAKLTETDLMIAAYEASKLYGKFPEHFLLIDTPKGNLPRPTTETTVADFCAWLRQQPEIRKITFVSNQPHVEYQKAIIAQVFSKQAIKVDFEVIGPGYDVKIVNNNAKQINYLVQALGSRIWAATPEVINTIGLDLSSPKLRAEYLELYKKQPLIYQNLDNTIPKPKL